MGKCEALGGTHVWDTDSKPAVNGLNEGEVSGSWVWSFGTFGNATAPAPNGLVWSESTGVVTNPGSVGGVTAGCVVYTENNATIATRVNVNDGEVLKVRCGANSDVLWTWVGSDTTTANTALMATSGTDWKEIDVILPWGTKKFRMEVAFDDTHSDFDFVIDNIRFERINPASALTADDKCDILDTDDSQLRQSQDLGIYYGGVNRSGTTVGTDTVAHRPWVECANYHHSCTVLMWTNDDYRCANANKGFLHMFKGNTSMYYYPPCPDLLRPKL